MKKCIYLNNAATTYPKPEPVLKAIFALLGEPPCHHARTGFDNHSVDIVDECRRQLALLFNAPDPSRIAFSSGSTESLNLAVSGLNLDGKHVITTAVEHNSVLRPLKTMEQAGRITLSIAPCNPYGLVSPESIQEAITPDTGAVVVNHCSNVTGMVNDIQAMGAVIRQHGIPFIVDASQSAGVYPVDVQKAHIDILAFTGHKSLYGIQGIGGAYIREGLELTPLKAGGTGVRSDYMLQPETVPMRYEAGTQNLPGICALYEGVRYVRETGLDHIRLRKESLVLKMRQGLAQSGMVTLFPDNGCDAKTAVFCFTVTGMGPSDIGYILENNFNIVVRSGLHCAPLIHKNIGTFPEGSVRVSPSHFTTDDDIAGFAHAMGQVVQMVK